MENITVSLYKSPINFIIVSAIENKKKATVPVCKLRVFYSLIETLNLLLYLITKINTNNLMVSGIKK